MLGFLECPMLKGLAKIFQRHQRNFEAFQVEISSYSSPDCETCPRAIFAEEWIFQNMSMATFQNIARHFALAQWIFFQGWGDPLENPEIIPMLQIAKGAGCKVRLTTQGFLLDSSLSESLIASALDLLVIRFEGVIRDIEESLHGGSEFNHVLQKIRDFIDRRGRRHEKNPRVTLSFLMTRLNMAGLPKLVPLAADLGVDELAFSHLDYLPNERCNLLRAFYHESRTPAFEKTVDQLQEIGRQYGISTRIPPLQAKEVFVCEPNPLRRVFFAVDGSVAPCPYLRIPKRGDLPRIFLHRKYTVPQMAFGNIGQEDFLAIWQKASYEEFRNLFGERRRAEINMPSIFDLLSGDRSLSDSTISHPPFPAVCQSCYKAYGI